MEESRSVPEFETLQFNALRNALYHTARRQRLEGYSRALNLLVILGGAGTVVDFVQNSGFSTWLGILLTLVGSLQLVFDFSGRASKHEVLQRRFYDVLSKLHGNDSLNESDKRSVLAELMHIYGDEPPTMRALDAVAYNEAADALYGSSVEQARLQIKWWQYLTRHLISYSGTEFSPKKS